jgi:hypothetical protein
VTILFEQFYCPSSTTIAKWIRAYEIRLKLPKFYESNRFGWHNIKFTLNFNESNIVQKMQFYSLARYQLNESIEQIHFELTKLFCKNSPSISILKEWINCYYLEYANQAQVKEQINEMAILNSRINNETNLTSEDFNSINKNDETLNQIVDSQPINLNADTMIINNETNLTSENFNPIVKNEKNLNQTVNSQPIKVNLDSMIIKNENRRFFLKEEEFNPLVKEEKNLNQTVNSQPIKVNVDSMIIKNENRQFFLKEEEYQTPLVESEEILKHSTEFKREPFITIEENLKENETIDKLIEDIVRNKLKRKLKKKSKLINSHLYDAFQIIEKLQSQITSLKENEINLLKKNEELKSFINKFEKYEPLCLPKKRVNRNIFFGLKFL